MNRIEMILKIMDAVASGNDCAFLPDPCFTQEEHEEALFVFRMKKRVYENTHIWAPKCREDNDRLWEAVKAAYDRRREDGWTPEQAANGALHQFDV